MNIMESQQHAINAEVATPQVDTSDKVLIVVDLSEADLRDV